MKIEGIARVFIGPEPDTCGHEGLRGSVLADEMGVHFYNRDVAWLLSGDDEWTPFDTPGYSTIPWHRIHTIEWVGHSRRA